MRSGIRWEERVCGVREDPGIAEFAKRVELHGRHPDEPRRDKRVHPRTVQFRERYWGSRVNGSKRNLPEPIHHEDELPIRAASSATAPTNPWVRGQ